jgi:ferric-dicitrate binding protein FerR (iron transport regulator)
MVQLNTSNESNTLIKTLEDGSVIYIARNSLFSFPREFSQDKRNVELKGEAFFDIASNPAKPFIIETEAEIIEVLGTAFNVRTENGKNFELTVDRGRVKVTMKNQPSVSELVTAGQKVTTLNNRLVKSKFSSMDVAAWYTHRMHFKDEPLLNILSVLNRNFNTTFVASNPQIGNRRLTVTFEDESAETMTELICLSLNLKSQVKNDSIVLSDNKTEARENQH